MIRRSLGMWAAERLSNTLPRRMAFGLADTLSDLQWRRSARDRATVRHNLGFVVTEPLSDHAEAVRQVFRNFGRYLVEFLTMHQEEAPEVTLEGYTHLEEALRQHHGVIILTAHVGNWELGAVVLRRLGFAVSAVALPHQDAAMDRVFNRQRERFGIQVIPMGVNAARGCLASLKGGHLLGLVGDRLYGRGTLAVTFGGRQVLLPRGPAALSAISRAAIVPAFVLRDGPGRFRMAFEAPIAPPSRGEPSLRAATQVYAGRLEQRLRGVPTQWLLFERLRMAP